MRGWWAQTRAEVSMTVRRGETLLLTVGIPVTLLVFFTEVRVTATPPGPRVSFFAPGIIGLCVMSTSLVALSISTAFERSYGVLKRLHVTPLSRTRLITAKIVAVVLVQIFQVSVVVGVAVALGWRPSGGVSGAAQTVVVLLLATASFAGVGLALAGRLRAELNLAAANGLYLVLLLLSGFIIPVTTFPRILRNLVAGTPSGAMANGLHRVLTVGGTVGTSPLICLVVWAVLAPLLAARTFRFD